jgi:anti-anti-sigma factor
MDLMAVAPQHPQLGSLSSVEPGIEVIVDHHRTGDYSAVVALTGEHDLATGDAVRVALAPLGGRILVDLTECAFIDSTIIGILVKKAGELSREGRALELRVPLDSVVAHALAVIGLYRFLTIREVG